MAMLTNISRFGKQIVLCKNNYSKILVRCVYQKDTLDYWKPGKYPTTEEEKRKAAKKYNLHPAEYKPLPENYAFKSDYPDLPAIGEDVRDPHYPWDYPIERRMVHEPMHQHYELLTYEKYDYGRRYNVDPVHGAVIFVIVMLVGFFITTLFDPYSNFNPVVAKQYPAKNVVHYTFEPAK